MSFLIQIMIPNYLINKLKWTVWLVQVSLGDCSWKICFLLPLKESTLRWTAQKHIPITQLIFGWVLASFTLAFHQVFIMKLMLIRHGRYNLPLVMFVFLTGERKDQCLRENFCQPSLIQAFCQPGPRFKCLYLYLKLKHIWFSDCRYCEVSHLGGGSRCAKAAQSACSLPLYGGLYCSSICVFTENTNKVKKDSNKNDKAKEK